MKYILGADGGGTKTRAVIINEERKVVGKGLSGPSNIRSEGVSAVIENLDALIKDTCADASIAPESLSKISLGLAGVATEDGRLSLHSGLIGKGYQRDQINIQSDAMAALSGAHGGEDGIILIAGTGMVIMGVKEDQLIQSGGWGHILGDEGSAYWIGLEGIKAVLTEYDQRGQQTQLTEAILKATSSQKVSDLVDFTYTANSKKDLAQLARVVFDNDSDHVAQRILTQASQELYAHIEIVQRRLGGGLPIALIGGVVENDTMVRRNLIKLLEQGGMSVNESPTHAPEIGAALLAM